jgi:hypothetical protein
MSKEGDRGRGAGYSAGMLMQCNTVEIVVAESRRALRFGRYGSRGVAATLFECAN